MNSSNIITGIVQPPISGGQFMQGNEGTPTRSACSIGAALQLGLVARHEQPGYIWLADGRGKMRADSAIQEGIIDAEAAVVIAAQPGCVYSAPMAGKLYPAPARGREGTLQYFDGTPAGDIVAALKEFSRNPYAQEPALKLAEALDRALQVR